MASGHEYRPGDDLPKENPWLDDRLGFAPFAERVARVVYELHVPNGYVIGLHGVWGSGKTTAVNFIKAYLNKYDQEATDHLASIKLIDFRPWIVAGHQDLIAAFFKVLSEGLGPTDNWWMRRWKGFLRVFRGTSDTLIDSVATLALGVDPTAGVASGTAGNLVKRLLASPIDRFLENPSLQVTYDALRKQLAADGRRFFVTIDDLDRLEDDEVRSIMQMVKTVGRLPNVVYLLVYDRAIVSKALDGTEATRVGPRFAEKLVQQELELPNPTKAALLAVLDEEINFLTGEIEDSTRWQYIVRDGISRWIRSPRDVVRLSNALKFSWSALKGEIDPQDLLAMDGLRLFDESTFYWVRDNRDFLFGTGRFILAADEANAAMVDSLKRRIDADKLPEILRVLSVLFPRSAKSFEGKEAFSDEDQSEVDKRRGIGSDAGYDAYFALRPSKNAIPKSAIDAVMADLDDASAIRALFKTYAAAKDSSGHPLIVRLVEELRIRFRGRNPARPTRALLDVLFEYGDQIISTERGGDIFELSPRAQISFLVRNMIEQWGPAEAGQHLIEAYARSTNLAFLADVYVDRGRELGVFKSESAERPSITAETFEALGVVLMQKILLATSDGTINAAPFYFDIIRAWERLGNFSDLRNWLSSRLSADAKFYAKVAIGMVKYSVTGRGRRYSPSTFETTLFDPNLLLEAGSKHLAGTELTDDQRNLVSAVMLGAERALEGKPIENAFDGMEN